MTSHTDGIVLATKLLSNKYGFDFKEGYDLVMEEKKRTSPNYRRFKNAADKTRDKIREQEEKIEKGVARNAERTQETIQKLKEKLDLQLNRLDEILKPTPLPDIEHVMERPKSPHKKPESEPKAKQKPTVGAGTGLVPTQEKFKKVTETLRKQLEEAATEKGMTYKKKNDKEFIEFINEMDPVLYDSKTTSSIIDEFLDMKKMSNVPTDITKVLSVGLKELEALDLITLPEHPGIYWSKDRSEFVTGPREDDDSGRVMNTATLDDGTEITVDQNTGRVYVDKEGSMKFVGFVGVYPFEDLEIQTDDESESD